MKATLSPRGSLLCTVWLSACAAVLGVACWLLLNLTWGLSVFGILVLLAAVGCRLRRIDYSIEVRDRECVISRGILLRSIVKLPRRYITAVTDFSTPLSRAFGVGVLVLCSSGRFTILIGLSLSDIAALRELLRESGAD